MIIQWHQAFNDPTDLESSVDALAFNLAGHFGISSEGYLEMKRERIDTQGKLSFWINAEDHPPPHFHVRTADFDVALRIDNGEVYSGVLPAASRRSVKHWWKANQTLLVRKWEELSKASPHYGYEAMSRSLRKPR